MGAIQKIESGIKWAIGSFLLFLAAALVNSYYSGTKSISASLPTAIYFSIYGIAAGFIFGYVRDDEPERTGKLHGKKTDQKVKNHVSVFGTLLKIIESIFVNLKFIFFLAVVAAGFYIYLKYFRR